MNLRLIRLVCGVCLLAAAALVALTLLGTALPYYWSLIWWENGAPTMRLFGVIHLASVVGTLTLLIVAGIGLIRERRFGYLATYAAWVLNLPICISFIPFAGSVVYAVLPMPLDMFFLQFVVNGGFVLLVALLHLRSRQAGASDAELPSAPPPRPGQEEPAATD